jgi:hypothetical protein
MAKKAKKPTKPGDTVWLKAKPQWEGIVLRASDEVNADGKLIKHNWVVEFQTDTGNVIYTKKSQQLVRDNPRKDVNALVNESSATNAHLPAASRRPRRTVAAAVPMLEETDASSSQDFNNFDYHDKSEDDDEALAAAAANNLTLEDREEEEEGQEDELYATPLAPSHSTEDDSIEDPFLSDEEQEAPAALPPENYIMPVAGATVDALGEPTEEDYHLHGEIDIEPEDVHKAKWEKYKLDKAQLLLNGWIITKATATEGISIGATIETKARPRREGLVTGQIEEDGKKYWLVDFGDDVPESMAPQKLRLLQQSEGQEYRWILVEDSEPTEEDHAPVEYTDGIGLCGFNFIEAFAPPPSAEGYNEAYAYPYLKLLQKMWPGEWQQQLRQLNIKIAAENATGGSARQKIKEVSEQEWWIFIGVLISAGPQGKGGKKLWEKPQHRHGNAITIPVNYGPDGLGIMAFYRFKEIKAVFPLAFRDNSKADGDNDESFDPWNMVKLLVDGYNNNRHDWVAASVRKMLDESMSAFRPRTSKTGCFPNISYILRKPEPLGTEFKTIACTVTGKSIVVVLSLRKAPLCTRFDRIFFRFGRCCCTPCFCRGVCPAIKTSHFCKGGALKANFRVESYGTFVPGNQYSAV